MPKITFIDSAGTSRDVETKAGASIMEAAVQNMIPGIDADCGGVQDNSRLSCQILMSDELDGIVVSTPEAQ